MSNLRNMFNHAWRLYRPLIMVGLTYGLFNIGQALYLGETAIGILLFSLKSLRFVVVLTVAFSLIVYVTIMAQGLLQRTDGGLKVRYRQATNRIDLWFDDLSRNPLLFCVLCNLILFFQITFFIFQKDMIRFVNHYSWDNFFVHLDALVHFGYHPSDILIPYIRRFNGAYLLQETYFAWMPLMYITLGYHTFFERDIRHRMKYAWVFTLNWFLLGGILATVFSSVGPIFYHDFFPDRPNPYKTLLSLYQTNKKDLVSLIAIKSYLLEWVHSKDVITFNSISAMPSLHMGIAWTNTIYGFRINKLVGFSFGIFAIIIFLACVGLGFHYAIDCYFSIIFVSLMWWITDKMINKYLVLPDGQEKLIAFHPQNFAADNGKGL